MKALYEAPEHEFEAAHGLPQALPPGERLLWQGSPDWRALARELLHLRGLSVYFALLLAWRGVSALADGRTPAQAATAVAGLLGLSLVAVGLLTLLTWLVARTTVYTLTDRRVVMRIGIVLGITFNLPYRRIEAAGLRLHRDGTGDLPLLLEPDTRIGYLNLWPHARPWQVKRTQPMLRAVPHARHVAALLSAAWQAATSAVPRAVATPPVQVVPQPATPAGRQPLAA